MMATPTPATIITSPGVRYGFPSLPLLACAAAARAALATDCWNGLSPAPAARTADGLSHETSRKMTVALIWDTSCWLRPDCYRDRARAPLDRRRASVPVKTLQGYRHTIPRSDQKQLFESRKHGIRSRLTS